MLARFMGVASLIQGLARAKEANMSSPGISELELSRLGRGEVGYVKVLTPKQAQTMFPMVEGLPKTGNLFSLHAADGTLIAVTDTRKAVLSHAMDGELEIVPLH